MGTIKIDNCQTIDNGGNGFTFTGNVNVEVSNSLVSGNARHGSAVVNELLNRQLGLLEGAPMAAILDAVQMAIAAKEAGTDQEKAIRSSRLINWIPAGTDEIKLGAAVLELAYLSGWIT